MEFVYIGLLLILSGVYSGSEIAYITANRLRVEVETRQRGRLGGWVSAFLKNPDKLLTTTLVGNNIALVVYSTLMAVYLEPSLHSFWATYISSGITLAVTVSQAIIVSGIVLIFGEVLPKSIFRQRAEKAVFMLAVPLQITGIVLSPLIWLSDKSASLLMRLLGVDTNHVSTFLRRDFEILIAQSRELGVLAIEEEESELLSRVFDLGTMKVKEAMVPRTAIEAVDENISLDLLSRQFGQTGFSKLPVYHENLDDIIGVVFALDLFRRPETVKEITRKVRFVPESKKLNDLLQEFLESKTSIAVVIDEYGGTAGLVTIEDVLEELFGEIRDEFDKDDTIIMRKESENIFTLGGRVELDDLEEEFEIKLTEGDYETVAGFLLAQLGEIPRQGQVYNLNDTTFEILKASANKVDLVKMTRRPAESNRGGTKAL